MTRSCCGDALAGHTCGEMPDAPRRAMIPYRALGGPLLAPAAARHAAPRWALDWLHSHVQLHHRYALRNPLVRVVAIARDALFRAPDVAGDVWLARHHRDRCFGCFQILYALGTRADRAARS